MFMGENLKFVHLSVFRKCPGEEPYQFQAKIIEPDKKMKTNKFASVMELADIAVLEAAAIWRAGATPAARTQEKLMKCKLTGKIVEFENNAEDLSKLKIRLAGKDAMGKAIGGDIVIYCSPFLTKELKLQSMISVDIGVE